MNGLKLNNNKKCIFISNPLLTKLYSLSPLVSSEKQNLMCEEVASRINAINDSSLVEMIYCFYICRIVQCSSVFLLFFIGKKSYNTTILGKS